MRSWIQCTCQVRTSSQNGLEEAGTFHKHTPRDLELDKSRALRRGVHGFVHERFGSWRELNGEVAVRNNSDLE
jgi:hypothetical protein